jgi:hypothetical protein
MRLTDLVNKESKEPPRTLTYVESLEEKLKKILDEHPSKKYTSLEQAIMEGGHSL